MDIFRSPENRHAQTILNPWWATRTGRQVRRIVGFLDGIVQVASGALEKILA